MHYYQFNIGDYSSHTSRLSLIEDLAYRRLLDMYYLNERPFNECSTDVARDIGLVDNLAEVEYVLNKFFVLQDGFYINKRADAEIKAYQNKRETASKAGIASGKARKNKASEQVFSGRSTDVEPNIKHKTINSNDKPKDKGSKPKKRFSPPSLEDIKIHVAEKGYGFDPEAFLAHYESNGWKVGRNKMKCWKSACVNWNSRDKKNGKSSGFNNQDNRPRSPGDRFRAAIAAEERNGSTLGADA